MSHELPFEFEMPFEVFEKADAEPGKERRIGGLASVETKDKQQETLLQRGLDFSNFHKDGWFNDNHSKETAGVLGYPDSPAQYITAGTVLPSGRIAKADGHWVEGYLLDTPKATEVYELAKALQKTKRRLGFSVEGSVIRRTGPGNKVVAKAKVREVAITKCPVNTDATMDVLAKSLAVVESTEPNELEKVLGMGTATPGVTPKGPQTGMGAGQILAGQDLEKDPKPRSGKKKKKKKDDTKKSFTDTEARAWFKARLPRATSTQIERVVALTHQLKSSGKL